MEAPSIPPSVSSSNPPRGAVVIPCYNHGDTLGQVLSDLANVVPALPVVVVDDGSEPPVTPHPGVTVIRHPTNRGKGAAMVTGARHFQDTDFLVFVDADGQHPVAAIPALLEALDQPPRADLVIATRDFLHDKGVPFRHRVANIALAIEFLCLYGKAFPDVTCGLRVARTKSFLALEFQHQGYEVEIETISFMLARGYLVRDAHVQGVRYEQPSAVARGVAITAKLGISLLGTRLGKRTRAPPKIHESQFAPGWQH
jgi:glycosyltransferase involved in cell wall biosynthesis